LKTDGLRDVGGEFLASLNHEIRTPLSGILGMTDLLLETVLTDDQREYADATRVCAENLLEILNVTLEYSALSANQVQLEETEFSLLDTIQGILGEFAPKAQAKGLRLVSASDGSLPEMAVGDALRLRQLLWHLVGNAVKFTKEGQVEIRASAVAEARRVMVSIEVRDTGIGIAPGQLKQIFESFRQLETGLSRGHGGLGLGLAVAQKLVELLDGKIHVESELGCGSVFSVQLPLRLPATWEARSPIEARKNRGRVLVIDDNRVAQTIATHALKRQSFEVQCAGDGLEAVGAASKSQFDVILMDLQMPGWDGFETTARIREIPGYRDTPIIAVTANCSDENRARCASCGMQDFLAKPVRTRELVQTVEKYLEQEALRPSYT
jgi:CheY-like chemotaxis protein/anti-sigma regulatory factor (Ser/Thr protein kinase)